MMNAGITKRGRRLRYAALAMTALVGLVACAESGSKETASTDSVAEVKTKNAALTTCTFETKCAIGSMGAAGGTVIYNSPSNFNCGPSGPISLPCNFLEVASADWGAVLSQGGKINEMTGCRVGAGNIDLSCQWSVLDGTQATTTKPDIGASRKNFEAVKALIAQDANIVAPAAALPTLYVSASASPNVEANPFSLPSLAELVLACNYANGSPMRSDVCVPGTLKPGYQPGFYWSSTIASSETGQPVSAVNFKTGEISKQSRKNSFFIRPTRSFYSTLDTAAPTTVAPTVPLTTMPPVQTTVAARVRACTPASPCIPGDKREGTGGTVFLYVAAGFGCGSNPSSMRCVMMEFAQDGWASTLPTSVPLNGCVQQGTVDPKCPYTNSSNSVSVKSSQEVGLGYQNSSTVAASFTTNGVFAANNFAWTFRQDTVSIGQNWNLPSRDELVQLCNWANGSPSRTDACIPNVLKPGFSPGVYVSSTIDPTDSTQQVWAVNFATGQVFKQARTVSSYVRPVRTLRGFIEPGYVPSSTGSPTTLSPTTVPRTTLPPTTVPRTTVPPTTVPPTTIPRTTLPPTTVAPTTTAPTCANGGVCAVNNIGPGGGIIVYANAAGFPCGAALEKTCKYLEIAPDNWTGTTQDGCQGSGKTMTCPWQVGTSFTNLGTGTAIGMGAKNTAAMYAASPKAAAAAVRSYNGGGKTDWFIPSFAEANEFCKWAHFGNSGQTVGVPTAACKISIYRSSLDGLYPVMTSSETSATNVSSYYIRATTSLGPLVKDYGKGDTYSVWPMRAF